MIHRLPIGYPYTNQITIYKHIYIYICIIHRLSIYYPYITHRYSRCSSHHQPENALESLSSLISHYISTIYPIYTHYISTIYPLYIHYISTIMSNPQPSQNPAVDVPSAPPPPPLPAAAATRRRRSAPRPRRGSWRQGQGRGVLEPKT